MSFPATFCCLVDYGNIAVELKFTIVRSFLCNTRHIAIRLERISCLTTVTLWLDLHVMLCYVLRFRGHVYTLKNRTAILKCFILLKNSVCDCLTCMNLYFAVEEDLAENLILLTCDFTFFKYHFPLKIWECWSFKINCKKFLLQCYPWLCSKTAFSHL